MIQTQEEEQPVEQQTYRRKVKMAGGDCFYAVSAGQCESAIILSVGDKVLIQDAAAEGDIRQAGSIRKD